MKTKELKFRASESSGDVSALLLMPDSPKLVYVLAHGAGAGMHHAFMEDIATRLAGHDIATLRYQFPYMEKRRGRPDAPAVATATVRSAVMFAAEAAPGLPLIAGGKSFGGRMTSTAQSEEPLPGVKGLAFLGFPLHAPGRAGDKRAAHLYNVDIPMLFLQGTRDTLADLDFMRPVCEQLGKRAKLHIVEGGDHSFKVLKRSGRAQEDVMAELAATIASWSAKLPAK